MPSRGASRVAWWMWWAGLSEGGVSPMPYSVGHQTMGLTKSLQGCVGRGQGARRRALIEAVNHGRLQDRGCDCAQRCTGVITIPSHLASRYMGLFNTTDLTWQPFTIFEIFWKCWIYISCPSFTNPAKRDSQCAHTLQVLQFLFCSFSLRSKKWNCKIPESGDLCSDISPLCWRVW